MTTTIIAQNESVYLSIGKPWYSDKINNLNNFSLGVNYQNKFSQSFAFEIVFEYAQSNNYPHYYKNSMKLNQFLINQKFDDIFLNSQWSKINDFNLGGKICYLFVNNDRFLFDFNAGFGFLLSKSSNHNLQTWTFIEETGQIISYENSINSDNYNEFYYSFGLQFQYSFYKDYFIGLNPYLFLPLDNEKTQSIPVFPSRYSLTLNFGKKF